MGKIKVLPPEIVAKIAAGEVIERPASVLKELVENSLDAKATRIEVSLKNAGKTLIRVRDDGTGIQEEDLSGICGRHATSKISKAEDLFRIASLGFRGEALYSISAIADVLIRTRTKAAECGWELHVRGNDRLGQKPFTMPAGTEIEVQELFYNTPARRKFLKSNTSETSALLDTFIPYVLLFPAHGFRLEHDGKVLVDLPEGQGLKARIAAALNLEEKSLIEGAREFKEAGISIRLVLGDINIQRGRKDLQFVSINNRPVQSKSVSFHLNDVYRLLLSPGVYPFFFCHITMPAEDLDVNVHPAKREVKMRDESQLIPLLRRFTEELLMTKSAPRQGAPALFNTPPAGISAAPYPAPSAAPARSQGAAEQQQDYSFPEATPAPRSDLKGKLEKARYLGSFLKKYLLFETTDSLLLVDQHAAQERINFEALEAQFERAAVEVQQLLTPYLVRLTPQEKGAWEEHKAMIEGLGFSCSLFDKDTLAIHCHPQLITKPEQSVRNLLAGMHLEKLGPETLARMACRSSVMAGDSMNREQAEFQRAQLLRTQAPFTCPHGRPTVLEIPESSLSRQFLR